MQAKGNKSNPKGSNPNHVRHLSNVLSTFRSKALGHPLMVPGARQAMPEDDQLVPMKSGEYVIPEPVVKRKGTQFFDNLVKKTLEEVLPPEQAAQGGSGTPQMGFKYGGEIPENVGHPISRFRGAQFGTYPARLIPPPGYGQGNRFGMGRVSNYQQVHVEGGRPPRLGGVDIPPADLGDPFGGLRGERGLNGPAWASQGHDPGMWQGGQPGYPWMPTLIPTTYNPQGYPRAVPVVNPPADIWSKDWYWPQESQD